MRPELDENLTPEDFQEFRWLKAELVDFCRQHGLPVDGGKHRIRRRVASYLAAQRAIERERKRK